MNTKTGEQFLHKRDVSLQASQEVESVVDYLKSDGEKIPNDPAQRLEAYLGFLARDDYVNDGLLTGDPESMNRQIAALVIKPDDIPESYFDLQRRVAREQGHGDIEITDQIREQLTSTIQEDQVKSLEAWGGILPTRQIRIPIPIGLRGTRLRAC